MSFNENYSLRRILGKGSYGKVYRCVRKKDDVAFAVKVYFKSSDKLSKRTIWSIQQWSGLKHANIVQFEELLTENDVMICVMELPVNFTDLFDLVGRRTCLPLEDVLAVLMDLMAATEYLKYRLLHHNDIKEENLLYNPLLRKTKLIDMDALIPGVSGRITWPHKTDLHSPPEYKERGSYYQELGLSWTMGCLIFGMITGDLPYKSHADAQKWIANGGKNFDHVSLQPEVEELLQITLVGEDRRATQTVMKQILTHYQSLP